MADALQSSQSQMASAGQSAEGDPQEMQGSEGFNPDGSAKSSQGQGKGGQPSRSVGGSGGGLGGPGIGVGGKVPPVGGPMPGKKIDTMVKGTKGPGEEMIRPFRGSPDRANPRASYYDVYPSARQAAEDALNKEPIPSGYKKQVKEYFDAIAPK
jgi:hypothetical protein